MSKYKYLLFDIDDTLINFEKSFHNCAAKVLELGGCEVTGRNVRRFKELNDIVWFSSGLEDIYEPYIKEIIIGSITNMWKIHWIKQLTNSD